MEAKKSHSIPFTAEEQKRQWYNSAQVQTALGTWMPELSMSGKSLRTMGQNADLNPAIQRPKTQDLWICESCKRWMTQVKAKDREFSLFLCFLFYSGLKFIR